MGLSSMSHTTAPNPSLRLGPDEAKLEGVTVELKPETGQLVQEEIRSGHIHSVDELIV